MTAGTSTLWQRKPEPRGPGSPVGGTRAGALTEGSVFLREEGPCACVARACHMPSQRFEMARDLFLMEWSSRRPHVDVRKVRRLRVGGQGRASPHRLGCPAARLCQPLGKGVGV